MNKISNGTHTFLYFTYNQSTEQINITGKTIVPEFSTSALMVMTSLLRRLFQVNEGFMLVDGILHAIVEQNPPTTLRKFVKYSLPKIVEQSTRKSAPLNKRPNSNCIQPSSRN
jgi:hypothetical protein